MIHKFCLSPRGSGVSCDGEGAFVSVVPMLERFQRNGEDEWRPRDCDDLSEELSRQYGLPIDMASKKSGLHVIAKALNDGDLARAQIATTHLGVPDPPPLSKQNYSRDEMIALIRDLEWSGMLKWDDSEHPRWPAGAPEGQGGQFAPKDEGGDGPRPSPTDATHAHDPQQTDAATQPKQSDASASKSGIYANYGVSLEAIRRAGAAIPMAPVVVNLEELASWENLKRLANGALKLGSGEIVAAGALLAAADSIIEKYAVQHAIEKFGLDPSQAADVLAARAYVWATYYAPKNFYDVQYYGSTNESVARFIAGVERERPGTLYRALQGDPLSSTYLLMAAQDGLSDAAVLESRRGPENAPAELKTTSYSARKALNLESGDGMRAHHLVPVNVIAKNLDLAMLAWEKGWIIDSKENLIKLPGNPKAQAELAALGENLPIQNSQHPKYDIKTQEQIDELTPAEKSSLTPKIAFDILETVAKKNRDKIKAGEFNPILKTS